MGATWGLQQPAAMHQKGGQAAGGLHALGGDMPDQSAKMGAIRAEFGLDPNRSIAQ